MTTSHLIELIGYIGSALVLISFLMTSVFKLRVVNMIGGLIFMIYALLIRSYPTAVMNAALVVINLRFLWKMRHHEKEFELVKVNRTDAFLQYVLDKYAPDIRACFPGLSVRPDEADISWIISCQGTPVGVFLGKDVAGKDHATEILLDYSTPGYRDFSLGYFLFPKLKEAGKHTLIYRGPDVHHKAYLEKMGFRKTEDGYRKDL